MYWTSFTYRYVGTFGCVLNVDWKCKNSLYAWTPHSEPGAAMCTTWWHPPFLQSFRVSLWGQWNSLLMSPCSTWTVQCLEPRSWPSPTPCCSKWQFPCVHRGKREDRKAETRGRNAGVPWPSCWNRTCTKGHLPVCWKEWRKYLAGYILDPAEKTKSHRDLTLWAPVN